MAAGLINDCTAWVLLALVVALLNSSGGLEALYIFLTAVGFSLFLIFLIGPLYRKLCVATHSFEQGPSPLLMTVTLLIVLVSAFVTDIIGIHPIFGGFLAGVIIPHEHDLPIKITEKIEDIVNIIFLPLVNQLLNPSFIYLLFSLVLYTVRFKNTNWPAKHRCCMGLCRLGYFPCMLW